MRDHRLEPQALHRRDVVARAGFEVEARLVSEITPSTLDVEDAVVADAHTEVVEALADLDVRLRDHTPDRGREILQSAPVSRSDVVNGVARAFSDHSEGDRLRKVAVVDHVLLLFATAWDPHGFTGQRILDEDALSGEVIGGADPAELPGPVIRCESK